MKYQILAAAVCLIIFAVVLRACDDTVPCVKGAAADCGAQVEIFIFAHKGRHKLRGKRIANFWHIPRDPAGDHPTPKPVNLMERMITHSTDAGDAVLDPFMGSGSTGVAAINLGRKFVGIEIERRYFDMACERIDKANSQGRLFA